MKIGFYKKTSKNGIEWHCQGGWELYPLVLVLLVSLFTIHISVFILVIVHSRLKYILDMSASALTLVKKYWWDQLFESTAFIIIRTSVHDKFYFVQFRKVPTTNYQYERKTLTSEEFAFGNLSITLVLKYDISITSDKVTNQITLPKGRIQRNAMNNRAVWAFSWEADQGNQSGTLVGIRHNFQNNKKKQWTK